MSDREMSEELGEVLTLCVTALRAILEDDELLELMQEIHVPGTDFTYADYITGGPLVAVADFNEKWGVSL